MPWLASLGALVDPAARLRRLMALRLVANHYYCTDGEGRKTYGAVGGKMTGAGGFSCLAVSLRTRRLSAPKGTPSASIKWILTAIPAAPRCL